MVTTPANNETVVCVHVCVFMSAHVRACIGGHILTSPRLRTYLSSVVCFYIATFVCIVNV